MSANVWPPISHEQLIKEEEESLAAELEWLLNLLQGNLASLKSGLQECVALLAPEEPGSTLALSSLRSESVKGFVTRIGTRIVKGDINLRLLTLPTRSPHPLHLAHPLPLPQLSHLLTLLNQALDIIDITTWTGDPHNASFIASQLKLLADTIAESRSTLHGDPDAEPLVPGAQWTSASALPANFDPPLPPSLSFHLSIVDAALVLHLRTVQPAAEAAAAAAAGGFTSLRTKLGLAPREPVHDELEQVFVMGGVEVMVREKVRVESGDPSLMAVMAKLSALEHAVAGWRARVACVKGEEVEVE